MSELPNSLSEERKTRLTAAWLPKNFDLLGYGVRVVRSWRLILAFTVLGLLAGLANGLLEKRYYVSVGTFMPPPAELNSTAVAGTSLALLSTSLQGDMYLYFLTTRTLTADVVERMGMAQHYQLDPETARIQMMKRATFDVQRAGVVTVVFRDADPAWAAKVVNGYVDALYRLEGRMVTTAYLHRREFFEDQLRQAREKLEKSEDVVANSRQELGVQSLEGAYGVEQGTETGLQSQIDGIDTQLAVLLKSQTEQSPAVIQLRNQRNALGAQLSRLKNSGENPNRGIQGVKDLPETIVKQNRLARTNGERSAVYGAILGRYQLAEAAEADPGPQFEVIDAAVPAPVVEQSKAPKYSVEGAVLGFLAGVVFLFAWPVVRSILTSFRQRLREDAPQRQTQPAVG